MNLKKIEREIERVLRKVYIGIDEKLDENDIYAISELKSIVSQAIKQVVESVPDFDGYDKMAEHFADSLSKGRMRDAMIGGKNAVKECSKEIKQWKKKILKELEGE